MKKITLFLLVLINSFLIFAENEFYIKPEANWVEPITFDENYHLYNDNKADGGTFLLIDVQDNVASAESFRHYAVKIDEKTGIQNYSDIWVNYEPTYQQLIYHKLVIHRNGKVLQRLNEDDFTIVQNETDLERKIFNGYYSAGINIEDVQIGDIIEYAFTIKGQNPVFKNNYFNFFYLEYSVPVNKLNYKITYPKTRNISYKLIKTEHQPLRFETNEQISLKWELNNVPEVVANTNLPKWYIVYGNIQFSEFQTWNQVVEWSKSLYQPVQIKGSDLEQKFNELTKDESNKFSKINALIRFVKDEVRYVGIEVDEHSHKPHDPFYVYKKRFGDCKDKSYLLVTLLNHLGVEAWPAYVNSNLLHTVNDLLPSPINFNHVIVSFIYKGKLYFTDPTLSNQHSTFENAFNGDYRSALVLNDTYSKPIAIEQESTEKIVIKEFIEASDTIAPAKYKVVSTYYGSEADRQRANNQNSTQREMQNSYLNFYSYLYPNMSLDKDFKIEDNEKENTFVIEENYLINKFWVYNESPDLTDYIATINASNLEYYITNPSQRNRSMPFALYYPIEIENTIEFTMNKDLSIDETKGEINNNCFNFSYDVRKEGKAVVFTYNFKSLKDFVSVDEFEGYYKDIDQISDNIWYEFNFGVNSKVSNASSLNWLLIVLSVFFVIILVFFASKLYQRDVEVVGINREPLPIGGWLILPIIGIIISPFIIAYQLYITEYFDLAVWDFISSKDSVGYNVTWSFAFLFELLMNCFFIIYTLFLVFLVIKRRTIFPIHYVWFRIINLVFVIADAFIVTQINSEYFVNEEINYKEIVKSFLGSMIWIPYMLQSQRVKDTFINKFKKSKSNN